MRASVIEDAVHPSKCDRELRECEIIGILEQRDKHDVSMDDWLTSMPLNINYNTELIALNGVIRYLSQTCVLGVAKFSRSSFSS